eukprot:1371408-Pyramimonas_sp.AAC.1
MKALVGCVWTTSPWYLTAGIHSEIPIQQIRTRNWDSHALSTVWIDNQTSQRLSRVRRSPGKGASCSSNSELRYDGILRR